MTDLLTGLDSRHQLHLRLPELAAGSSMAAPLSLLLLKIRDFSLWQCHLTPLAADRLLRLTAELLREHCPAQAVAARWGGATFALALPNCPYWQAEDLAETIRLAAGKAELPAIFNYEGQSLDFHYGCDTLPPADIWQLSASAEAALKRDEGGVFAALEGAAGLSVDTGVLLKLARGYLTQSGPYLPRLATLTCSLAVAAGRRLGLGEEDLNDLELSAAFADIALSEVAGLAIDKPGPLREQEWRRIQRHSFFASRLAVNLGLRRQVAEALLYHHERYDGLGYPEGLRGADIPPAAAILHAATVYASLLLPRPYRPARRVYAARAEISLASGKDIDPQIAKQILLVDAAVARK